jgi:hypothetical protein
MAQLVMGWHLVIKGAWRTYRGDQLFAAALSRVAILRPRSRVSAKLRVLVDARPFSERIREFRGNWQGQPRFDDFELALLL